MPSLRVVSGSSLLVIGVMSALAFGFDSQVPDGLQMASVRITGPIGVESVQIESPAMNVLADMGVNKTRTVIDSVAILEEPRDEKTEAESREKAKEMRAAATPVVLVALPAPEEPSVVVSGGSNRIASASSPVMVSVIGAAALALVGGAVAVMSRSRKLAH